MKSPIASRVRNGTVDRFENVHTFSRSILTIKYVYRTPDGTCVVTSSEDSHLRTFIL